MSVPRVGRAKELSARDGDQMTMSIFLVQRFLDDVQVITFFYFSVLCSVISCLLVVNYLTEKINGQPS